MWNQKENHSIAFIYISFLGYCCLFVCVCSFFFVALFLRYFALSPILMLLCTKRNREQSKEKWRKCQRSSSSFIQPDLMFRTLPCSKLTQPNMIILISSHSVCVCVQAHAVIVALVEHIKSFLKNMIQSKWIVEMLKLYCILNWIRMKYGWKKSKRKNKSNTNRIRSKWRNSRKQTSACIKLGNRIARSLLCIVNINHNYQ